MRVSVYTLLLAACLVCTSTWADTASETQAATTTKHVAKEKRVCKNEIVTGSRFVKRVCWTPSEHAEARERGQRETESVQRNSAMGCIQGACGGG
jgi:hypothetical protein